MPQIVNRRYDLWMERGKDVDDAMESEAAD